VTLSTAETEEVIDILERLQDKNSIYILFNKYYSCEFKKLIRWME
jgi:hypothetical protein